LTVKKLSEKKKSELGLIAALTLDATLAAEEKLSKLAGRRKGFRSCTNRISHRLTPVGTALGSKLTHT